MNLLFALIASIIVSLISLIGIIGLLIEEKLLKRIIIFLVAFAAGGLIGGAFLHILPEALEQAENALGILTYVILGFILFFILEKYLYWRHCHQEKCEIHAFTYLNLIGDGIHNFFDGLIIGASFFGGKQLGIVASIAIIIHEIPQELGDFGVLLHGGFSKTKALFFNFLSALLAVVGTVFGYYFSNVIGGFSSVLLPLAAGGFIYIASCDLIPELHKETELKKSTFIMLFFIIGIALMYLLKMIN